MKEKIIVHELKKLLKQIVTNQNRLATLIEDHEHDKEGRATDTIDALPVMFYGELQEGEEPRLIDKYDVNKVFIEKKDKVVK